MNANRKLRVRALPAALIALGTVLVSLALWVESDSPALTELSEMEPKELPANGASVMQQSAVPPRALAVAEEEGDGELGLRTPVDSSREEVAAEAGSEKVTIRGSVVLTDGTPARFWQITLLDPAAEPGFDRSSLGRTKSMELVLVSGWTDEQGEFEFHINRRSYERSFRIEQMSKRPIGQSDRLYSFDSIEPIEHVLPGGHLTVEVLDFAGNPVRDPIRTWAFYSSIGAIPKKESDFGGLELDPEGRLQPYGSVSQKQSNLGKLELDPSGVMHVYYSEPIFVNLEVARSRDGAFGELTDLFVDPRAVNHRQSIELAPLEDTAQLQVEVLDQNDLPVSEFAITVWGIDRVFGPNYVASEDLWNDGILTGLPTGRVEVELTERTNGPPALYSDDLDDLENFGDFADRFDTDESIGSNQTTLSSGELGRVTLRVTLETRLTIQLERTSEEQDALAARYRYLDSESEDWIELNLLYRFPEQGGSRYESMTGNHLYYSEVIRAGSVELEIFDFWERKTLWRRTVHLQDGIISPVVVRL